MVYGEDFTMGGPVTVFGCKSNLLFPGAEDFLGIAFDSSGVYAEIITSGSGHPYICLSDKDVHKLHSLLGSYLESLDGQDSNS